MQFGIGGFITTERKNENNKTKETLKNVRLRNLGGSIRMLKRKSNLCIFKIPC